MPRGTIAKDGDTFVSQNGYHNTKQNGKWRLTHHIIAEEILGRPLTPSDRVEFKDRDRSNLNPSNIQVVPRGRGSTRRRMAQVKARIDELQAEYEDLERELQR